MILRLTEFERLKFDLVKAAPLGQPFFWSLDHHVNFLELQLLAPVRRQEAGPAGDGQPPDALGSVPPVTSGTWRISLPFEIGPSNPKNEILRRSHREDGAAVLAQNDSPSMHGILGPSGASRERIPNDGPSDDWTWTTTIRAAIATAPRWETRRIRSELRTPPSAVRD